MRINRQAIERAAIMLAFVVAVIALGLVLAQWVGFTLAAMQPEKLYKLAP